MWFKTRVGLVCNGGTVEFLADRWSRQPIGKCAGVYAYQARHPEGRKKRLFRAPVATFNRKIYLACFLDNGEADDQVTDCMGRIAEAVQSGASLCDLSHLGAESAWGSPDYGVFVHWRNQVRSSEQFK